MYRTLADTCAYVYTRGNTATRCDLFITIIIIFIIEYYFWSISFFNAFGLFFFSVSALSCRIIIIIIGRRNDCYCDDRPRRTCDRFAYSSPLDVSASSSSSRQYSPWTRWLRLQQVVAACSTVIGRVSHAFPPKNGARGTDDRVGSIII